MSVSNISVSLLCQKYKPLLLLFFFSFCFFSGGLIAKLFSPHETASASVSPISFQTEDWGLHFSDDGQPPVGNTSYDNLKKYDAWYIQPTKKKILYLTFDCGYENGNTPSILEALKKHHAPATFFVVGNFLRDNPALIRQMIKDGHTIGNHTFHHPDMSQISTKESFSKELGSVESLYKDLTGKDMTRYYRPPQGKYNEENLQMAKDLGYHTFFWSLAYVDWITDAQPTKEEAFSKLLTRVHPGAIVLLHNTSKTNGDILDELLGKWEDMQYSFHSLDELVGAKKER